MQAIKLGTGGEGWTQKKTRGSSSLRSLRRASPTTSPEDCAKEEERRKEGWKWPQTTFDWGKEILLLDIAICFCNKTKKTKSDY